MSTFWCGGSTTVLHPKADIGGFFIEVCFVPIVDIEAPRDRMLDQAVTAQDGCDGFARSADDWS